MYVMILMEDAFVAASGLMSRKTVHRWLLVLVDIPLLATPATQSKRYRVLRAGLQLRYCTI